MNISATKKITSLLTILVITRFAATEILNQSDIIPKMIEIPEAKENQETGLTYEELFLNH